MKSSLVIFLLVVFSQTGVFQELQQNKIAQDYNYATVDIDDLIFLCPKTCPFDRCPDDRLEIPANRKAGRCCLTCTARIYQVPPTPEVLDIFKGFFQERNFGHDDSMGDRRSMIPDPTMNETEVENT